MSNERKNYTFTFGKDQQKSFNRILERMDPELYEVVQEQREIENEKQWEKEIETVINMDPDSALTFRLGMKNLKIRRERTEEELAEEAAIKEKNTVKVVVQVPPGTNTV